MTLDVRAAAPSAPPADPPPSVDRGALSAFRGAILRKSLIQIATSFGGFFAVVAGMYALASISVWLALALALPAAGFLVRIFIIQHDCGHGSFFRSRRANDALGWICGLLTLTPYASWRRQHAGHHANWNNLDRRDSGVDIYSSCLTVAEYRAMTRWQRFQYRLVRHPLVANVLLPPLVFILLYRVPFDTPRDWRRERRSVHLTNVGVAAIVATLGLTLGFGSMVAVQLPVMVLASIIGVWLFSVQHRFERTRWDREADWRYATAALEGSSHLRLPGWLRWFTGNIGLHHVHHAHPGIPNYRLAACHDATPALHAAPVLSLWQALTAWRYALWSEGEGRMVPFAAARARAA